MAEIPVLTCPVCGRSAGFRPGPLTESDALKDAAWDHLNAHRGLDEAKRAIYAVMMVEQRDHQGLPPDGTFEGSAGEWSEDPLVRP